MPVSTPPYVPHYVPAPVTTENFDWAEIPIVDLSKMSTPEGKAELVSLATDAMHTNGFMYVVNHGFTQAQTTRVFDIADVVFSQVPQEEKKQHCAKPKEKGFYRGYKLRQNIVSSMQDQLEHYSIHHTVDDRQQHPKALEPLLPEIRALAEHNHYHVLQPILRLLALGLELPEETFVDLHSFDAPGEPGAQSWVRYQKYFPYSEEDQAKANDVWLKGHTDSTSMSILWSQPISALQIMSPEGKWRWVRHIDNALVVNIGDGMKMLSGGFYKAAVHRVILPPLDQRGLPRLGIFYFVTADNDVKLAPLAGSPVLQRVGFVRMCPDEDAPTMEQWYTARNRVYEMTPSPKKANGTEEEEVLNGIFTTYYH